MSANLKEVAEAFRALDSLFAVRVTHDERVWHDEIEVNGRFISWCRRDGVHLSVRSLAESKAHAERLQSTSNSGGRYEARPIAEAMAMGEAVEDLEILSGASLPRSRGGR